MVTADDLKEAREFTRSQDVDYSFEEVYRPGAKAQWYKPDGTPFPVLLPSDPYHFRLYMKRGFTLAPPAGVVTQEEPEEVLQFPGDEVKSHYHHFPRAAGSVCKTRGCSAVRMKEFKSRKKRSG